MKEESQSTVSKWQEEHRQRLAAKGIEVPEEEPDVPPFFHCRRCHRNLPIGSTADTTRNAPDSPASATTPARRLLPNPSEEPSHLTNPMKTTP